MRFKYLLLAAGLAAVFVASVQAADVSGKWIGQVPGRGGQTRETTFNFRVDGETLTGTMASQLGEIAISDGKVQGDDISFKVTLNIQDNEVKLLFKGKASAEEIKFTRQREGADQVQEFTAKRAQ